MRTFQEKKFEALKGIPIKRNYIEDWLDSLVFFQFSA
jgi:hypothetical protein